MSSRRLSGRVMSDESQIEPLDPPPAIFESKMAREVLRFWVADGIDHLSLKIDAIASADGDYHGAEIWGSLVADIARHDVNAYEQDFSCEENAEELYALVNRGYNERLAHKAGISVVGKLKGVSEHAH